MFIPENFIKNLIYMGKGMVGIFIIVLIIIGITVILNKLTSKK